MRIKDSRFKVRMSRPGMGKGLFALADIKKGDFILEYTGERIPTKVADDMKSKYLFEIDKKWTVKGPPSINLAGYINHCCAPNTEAEIEAGADGEEHINIYAVRDIAAREEITIDYGEEYFDEFIKPKGCRCISCEAKRLQGII